MKTFTPKPADLTHDWYIIDAKDVVLGRLSVAAANLLRGKNKPSFAPHADSGNYVIIINADKIALTGDKMDKELYSHSGRPGGLRRDSYAELLKKVRGVAIVCIFLVAAVVTPPDIVSQCMVALPMVLLYFISIFLSGIFYKPKSDAEDEDDDTEDDE